MNASGQSSLLLGYGNDVGAKRTFSVVSAEEVTTDVLNAKRVRIGEAPTIYTLPEEKGNQGDVLVEQGDGSVIWEPQAEIDPSQIDHNLILNRGTLEHATIDSYLDQAVTTSADVSFNSLTAIDIDCVGTSPPEQDSMSRNQSSSGFAETTEGFQFSLTEPAEITAVGLQVEHLGDPGVRPFRIWRVSDQSVVLTSAIGSTYPIVNGRYKRTLVPSVVLPLGTYRVGIDHNGGKRNSTSQAGFLNANLLPVFGCFRLSGTGYPTSLSSQNLPYTGYLYFRQPLEVQGTLTARNVVIGKTPGEAYTLPSERGLVNQILKTNANGTVRWVDSPFDQNLNTGDSARFAQVITGSIQGVGSGVSGERVTILDELSVGTPGSDTGGIIIQTNNTGFPDFGFNIGGTPALRICSTSPSNGFFQISNNANTRQLQWDGNGFRFREGLRVNQTLTIGALTPATQYTLPAQTGYPGQLLKLGSDGQTLGWDTVGKYAQFETTVCNGHAAPTPTPPPTSMTLNATAASKGSLYFPANILKQGDCIHTRISGEILSEVKSEELTLQIVARGTDQNDVPITRILHTTSFVQIDEVKTPSPFEWEVDLMVRSIGTASLDNGEVYSNSQFTYTRTLGSSSDGVIWNSNTITPSIGLSGPTSDWTLDILASWGQGSALNVLTVYMVTITKTF